MALELVYDRRDDRRVKHQTIADASWTQVEEAIQRLDALAHTEVVLAAEAQMTIGGGAGSYFVSIYTEDERSLVLVDASKSPDGSVRLVSGGQRVLLPTNRVVDLPATLKAARTFLGTALADAGLVWVED